MDSEYEKMLIKIGIDAKREKHKSDSNERPTRRVESLSKEEAEVDRTDGVFEVHSVGEEEIDLNVDNSISGKEFDDDIFFPGIVYTPVHEESKFNSHPEITKKPTRPKKNRPTITMNPWTDR